MKTEIWSQTMKRAQVSLSYSISSALVLLHSLTVLEMNQQDWDSTSNHRSVSTRDLISWSFQIARGMGYLVSKNVRELTSSLSRTPSFIIRVH